MEEKDMYRDHTRVVQIGDRKIGGGNPILIQSMTNTKTEDIEGTVKQILALSCKRDKKTDPYPPGGRYPF